MRETLPMHATFKENTETLDTVMFFSWFYFDRLTQALKRKSDSVFTQLNYQPLRYHRRPNKLDCFNQEIIG